MDLRPRGPSPAFALALPFFAFTFLSPAPAGRSATEPFVSEVATRFANRTPSPSAVVVAAAGAQRMMGGEGLDFDLPAPAFNGPPMSFFVGQGSGLAPADIQSLLDDMTPQEQREWIEQTLPTLRDIHEALQAFRGSVRPSDLVEDALGPDGTGVGHVLRETYKLLKALELLKELPGLEQASQLRRFASALDGLTLLLDNLITREENGETVSGDDLRNLKAWMGDLETSLGLLGGLGSVNPVVSAMLSVYGGALEATAEVIDEVIVPYFQRLQEARQMVEETLGTVESEPFDGMEDDVDELGTLIDELEARLDDLTITPTEARYTDVDNAKIIALRSLGIDDAEYERLRQEWLQARRDLQQARSWFDEIRELRLMAWQAYQGWESSHADTFREELDRYRAALEAKQAGMAAAIDHLEAAYDRYEDALDAYMTVNDAILSVLRRYAKSADPDDDSTLGGLDFLLEHFPELFRYRWERGWIRGMIRDYRERLERMPPSTDTTDAAYEPPTDVVDITRWPDTVAMTRDHLDGPGPESGRGPVLVASVRASGNSTGPGAFDINIANLGKPVRVVGEFPVFRPATEEEAASLEDVAERLASVAEAANVVGGELGGYCLDKELEPPGAGEYYVLASAAEQELFRRQRALLVASRELFQSGGLNPDSDPAAYYHSIRQWTIWTEEHAYDEVAFTEAFVAFTRKNVEAAGQAWSEAIERAVRGIAPNRFRDIRRVLDRVGEGPSEVASRFLRAPGDSAIQPGRGRDRAR